MNTDMWNLTGLYIKGRYLGDMPVTGLVVHSRVKFGGSVQHSVELSDPLTVYGSVRERVLLDAIDVDSVHSSVL
jgi:hypothetical protein